MAEAKAKLNKKALGVMLGGVVVAIAVIITILGATATTKAVVLKQDLSAGTMITEDNCDEITVPAQTPGDFLRTKASVIGEKLANNVSKNQFIYANDLVSSVEYSNQTNDEYIITSLQLPDKQALGGLLSTGDTVDIAVAPNSGEIMELSRALPDYTWDTSVDGGLYYILSNVTIIDATSSKAQAEGSSYSSSTDGESGSSNSSNAYYLISISYNDYKKLMIAQEFGEIWLNLTPTQNEEKAPLLEQMETLVQGGLVDAETGKAVDGSTIKYTVDDNGNISLTREKEVN